MTSRGKTLVLQIAASVFGNAAASQDGMRTPILVQTWHGTQNAIEAQTAACSGTLVIFDEIGVSRDPLSIYSQTGGQGKGRAKADGSLQDSDSWSTLILSSGEIPLESHMESKGHRRMMGGEAARMLDVPVADLLPVGDPLAAEALKLECSKHFGMAGPAFVQWVINEFGGNEEEMRQALTSQVDAMRAQLCEEARLTGYKLGSQHFRAMLRLAHAAICGLWAVQADILPHSDDEILDAVRAVRDAWLSGQAHQSEEAKVIEMVRDYVQRYRGQMVSTTQGQHQRTSLPSNCHGILHAGRVVLTESNFRDACKGLDTRLVASVLAAAGILHRNDDQFKAKVSIAELGIIKIRSYVLDEARLFFVDDGNDVEAADPGELDL